MKTIQDIPEIAVKSAKAKSAVPVALIQPLVASPDGDGDGDSEVRIVERLGQLRGEMEQLAAEAEVLEREAKARGFEYVARTNIGHASTSGRDPISSVKFIDPPSAGDGDGDGDGDGGSSALMISVVNDYAKFDPKEAETLFATLRVRGRKADPNEYLHWQVVADFDASVFFTGDGNEFDREKYEVFSRAVQEAALEAGTENPLSLGKVCKVKETFHARRWRDFDLDDNVRLAGVLKCKLSAKLVRP